VAIRWRLERQIPAEWLPGCWRSRGAGGWNRSGSSRKRVAVVESRITHNPAQWSGEPCIRVSEVLDLYAAGLTADQILSELPDLEPEICRRP